MGAESIFNVERAPWWGGAFERLVRSTKWCLRKLIGRAQFSFDELVTTLAEIESVVNSRPLTYVSAGDTEEPLTPSHLIAGRRIHSLPDHLSHFEDVGDEEFSLNPTQLTRRMKHLADILNHFWNRWRSEYLSELREVHSYAAKTQSKSEHSVVSVGNIVVVHNEHLPRGLWKLGKIVSVMKGRDNLVRGATVKIGTKDGRRILLNRPIQLLYPLEVQSQKPDPEESNSAENEDDSGDVPESDHTDTSSPDEPADKQIEPAACDAPQRSRHAAAQRANANRMACMYELEDN